LAWPKDRSRPATVPFACWSLPQRNTVGQLPGVDHQRVDHQGSAQHAERLHHLRSEEGSLICSPSESSSFEQRRREAAGEVQQVRHVDDHLARQAAALRPRPTVTVVLTDGCTPWPDGPPQAMRMIVGPLGEDPPEWARAVRIPSG
jgi:hypothetical protein